MVNSGDQVGAGTGKPADTVLKLTEATPQQILEHRENVLSNDPAKQLHSTQHFRRLLSIGICLNLSIGLSFYFFYYFFVTFREESPHSTSN